MIERETETHLSRRRDESVPHWVSTLLHESTAWQLLYPGRVPKKRKHIFDDDDDDLELDDDDKKKPAAGTSVTSWPKFVQVVCLSRTPPPGIANLCAFKATYRYDAGDPPVELDKVILTPMVVHRNLGIHYQQRMVEGWSNDEAMEEINKYCGVPVVWRGCLPFTGSSDPKRLRNAWIINWSLWFLLLAWLAWSYLSLREELPWGGIISTMMVGIVIEPAGKIQKALAVGFIVYMVLEGPGIYFRYKNRFNPDYNPSAERLPLVEQQRKAHAEKVKKQEDEETANDPDYKKPKDQPPPMAAVAKVSARALVATARPEKAYEAMQIGTALRELDKRKHQETTAVARRLVPKLESEARRHESELQMLDECRSGCTDSVAIDTLNAQKSKMERAHAAAIKEIEADVRAPCARWTS